MRKNNPEGPPSEISDSDPVGEGGNGISCGTTVVSEDRVSMPGIREGTGFRFCGVILWRFAALHLGDGGTVDGAMEDGGDDLESWT
jgi:hypothetical protein